MDEPRLNYSGINYSGRSLHDIIKTQEDIINQLKGTIKVFEKNVEEKDKKLSDYDSLFIEYNSLLKNCSELEKELNISRNENMQLKNIINSKNLIINDFQNLVESAKTKFDLLEKITIH